VDTLARAARAAVARGATDAAIAYLRRALREPPAPHERAAMLLELGSVESGAADPLAIDHLSEAAEIAVDARVRARAHQALAFTLIAAGRVPEVEPAYDRAITAASEVDLGLALELETSLVAAAQMGMMPSTIATERLQRFDRDAITGDRPSERLLLGTLSFEALRRNEPADVAAGLAERALAGTPPPVEGLIESPPLTLALLALMYADRLELPTRIAADAAELAIARGSHRGFVIFSNFRAALSLRAGRLDDAEELGLEILRVEGAYGPGVQLIAASCVAQARVLRGALTGAEAILDDNGITAIAAEDCVLEEPIYARALLRAAQGDTERALEDMLAVGRRLLAVGSFGVAQYCWRSDAALMHAALGQRAEAARLADEQLALARAFGTGRTLGASLRAMGLLEPGDRGIELLTQAVAALDGSPASLEHARALVDLGAALRRSGRRAAAREPLARGREVALRCGALALVDEAGIELQAAGARPRRLMLTGVDALTTSQRRVAEMAARGLRNPEIAQALFISRKTVEMHLSNAYRTLDISSREQLGHALEGDEQKKVSGGSR
jgi:DNA-binding CsgD family transcriptional regulator